jgi:hypothetical protein
VTCASLARHRRPVPILRKIWGLLKHQRLRSRILLQPFSVILALLVGRALPGSNFVECTPLRFHPHVGVTRKHGARDVPGDAHDHFVAGPRFCQFGDQRMPVIMPFKTLLKLLK